MSGYDIDVAIVGAGPSGIAAATALSRAGVGKIVVYEREKAIGGIPRHTHHPSFGLLVFKRPLSGPKYIAALKRRCPDVQFETSMTLTRLLGNGQFEIATPSGLCTLRARHIILATGARETPRHARLIPGLRPQGVMTTGALQQLIYSSNLRPFHKPVIVGTELVSFSALWTLHHARIRPVAMIEANPRITAYRPTRLFARIFRVPVLANSKITDIDDLGTLRQITIFTPKFGTRQIACDGVIFSGQFAGENTVAGASHLTLTPDCRIPYVDQNWITSDPAISAIGNAVHPADMGDQCYLEGLKAGTYVARILAGTAAPTSELHSIHHGPGIKMTTPSILRHKNLSKPGFDISLHVNAPFRGIIRVSHGTQVLYQKTRNCLPARRIKLRNIQAPSDVAATDQPIILSLTSLT